MNVPWSKATLHVQLGFPSWIRRFLEESGVVWLKKMDPGDGELFPEYPNLRWLIRFHEDEGTAKAEVLAGKAGALQRLNRLRPELKKRPWLSQPRFYLEEMNERSNAGVLFSAEGRKAAAEHSLEYMRLLAEEFGIRVVIGCDGVGHPEPKHAVQLYGPALSEAHRYGAHWALHEYGWPTVQDDASWHCLRYRRTVAALREAGIPIPPLHISEWGIDRLLVGNPGGWKSSNNDPTWFVGSQVAWYDQETQADDYVQAFYLFTAAPAPEWMSYGVEEADADVLARYIRNMGRVDRSYNPQSVYVEPGIHDLSATLPIHPKARYGSRELDNIQRTVIHHTAVRPKRTDKLYTEQHIAAIARGHVRQGWPGIGYHFCIDAEGRVYQVNKLTTVSYHVGRHNASSVGVCLLGRFDAGYDEPTAKQLASARWLCNQLGYPIVPHKELSQTKCPGRWDVWGKKITGG